MLQVGCDLSSTSYPTSRKEVRRKKLFSFFSVCDVVSKLESPRNQKFLSKERGGGKKKVSFDGKFAMIEASSQCASRCSPPPNAGSGDSPYLSKATSLACELNKGKDHLGSHVHS